MVSTCGGADPLGPRRTPTSRFFGLKIEAGLRRRRPRRSALDLGSAPHHNYPSCRAIRAASVRFAAPSLSIASGKVVPQRALGKIEPLSDFRARLAFARMPEHLALAICQRVGFRSTGTPITRVQRAPQVSRAGESRQYHDLHQQLPPFDLARQEGPSGGQWRLSDLQGDECHLFCFPAKSPFNSPFTSPLTAPTILG